MNAALLARSLAGFVCLASLLLPFTLLATLDDKSFTGKISVEAGAFVITRAGTTAERVQLANVQSVAFDRVAAVAKPAK